MYLEFKEKVEFFVVYIREAHPTDGWRVPANDRDGIDIPAPKTYEERRRVANECIRSMKLSIPALVDGMSDTAEKAYRGWPDRFFVVSKAGKIAYAGERGPRGFKPDEVERFLKELKPEELKAQ